MQVGATLKVQREGTVDNHDLSWQKDFSLGNGQRKGRQCHNKKVWPDD